MYIYQQPDWPYFRWDAARLAELVGAVRFRQGRVLGHMQALGFGAQTEATWHTLTLDVLETSEIEGEYLPAEQVRSSVARHLGLPDGGLGAVERRIDGLVEVLLDATTHPAAPLTAERLFGWQAALFPGGHSGLRRIGTGGWRTGQRGPMQVVSGPAGRERVHFEAPEAARVPAEMQRFLAWYNDPALGLDSVLQAGVAHLWFVTIHPFEDGNGRLARALTDGLLARADGTSQRFYSLSAQLRHERPAYYALLEATQHGSLDITDWLAWFVGCLGRALEASERTLAQVVAKARFWERNAPLPLNARQRLLLNRLLDGFAGKLTSSKWAAIAKCSADTALRDIQGLLALGLLEKDGAGGRSTGYHLLPTT